MRIPTILPSLALLSIASLVACGGGAADSPGSNLPNPNAVVAKTNEPPLPTKPDSDKVKWKQDPSFAKCHNDVKTGADIGAGVTAMAQGCASALKMHQVGQTSQDTFKDGDKAHVIPLHAESGHCYRVYGLSEDALQDLDIAMMDSAGKECAEDGSDSPDAVLLEDGAVCFTATDDVNINVAAGSGSGKYVVQVWGD
ncbi:MAG TPA: hypothetical protein VF765_08750 [Polyangiaceae bacterium]